MNTNQLTIPLAIVIAGGLIAGAVILSGNSTDAPKESGAAAIKSENKNNKEQKVQQSGIPPISEKDHILGNPEAPVTVLTYTDLECPFCKKFHTTMQKIMDEYGTEGKVAWVVRQLPMQQLHPNAPQKAQAAECAARVGGEQSFWDFINKYFNKVPSKGKIDISKLPKMAEELGIEKAKFNECLDNKEIKNELKASVKNTIETGVRGTPMSFLISGDKKVKIKGAKSYKYVKERIEKALENSL